MAKEKNGSRILPAFFAGIMFTLFLFVVAIITPIIYTFKTTESRRYDLDTTVATSIPKKDVAIVFGAALRDKGTTLSPYLLWRVETAVTLYKSGVVNKLLMTGDGGASDHDEPAVMRKVAIQLGVPNEAIITDKFGFDTYDSCYRARNIRNISSAIVVTQAYHLPRAVYTCQKNGIDTIGVNAQARFGRSVGAFDIIRETFSTDKLFIQLVLRKFSL